MSSFSFDIKSSSDYFNKLKEDYIEFCLNKTSSRVAINCAMTSWHLADWTYKEFNQQLLSQFSVFNSYKDNLKTLCPDLKIMQDITNGSKHFSITKYTPKIKTTGVHDGDFNEDFSNDFDIAALEIELNDGTTVYFDDAIERVINFWELYLSTTFQIYIAK